MSEQQILEQLQIINERLNNHDQLIESNASDTAKVLQSVGDHEGRISALEGDSKSQ